MCAENKPARKFYSRGNEADVLADVVQITVIDPSRSLLSARFRLQAASHSDRRPVRIDFSPCPLRPLSIEGNASGTIDLNQQMLQGDGNILVALNDASDISWQDAEITIHFRWAKERRAHLVSEAFLYLPEELPTIGSQKASSLRSPQRLSVSLSADACERVVASTSYLLGTPLNCEGPHLQAIVAKAAKASYVLDVLEGVQVSLINQTPQSDNFENQDICRTIQEIGVFFGRQLEAVPALRIAIDLDATEETRSMPGALLSAPLAWLPISQRNQEGHAFALARMIANNWWGIGCRTSGPHGVSLAGGIAFAMGLAWARSHTPASYFDAILSGYRQRIVRKPFFARSASTHAQRTVELGVVIYDGLMATNSMWECLGPLTQRCWSLDTPERIVLETLASSGVKVTDFQRTRFVG